MKLKKLGISFSFKEIKDFNYQIESQAIFSTIHNKFPELTATLFLKGNSEFILVYFIPENIYLNKDYLNSEIKPEFSEKLKSISFLNEDKLKKFEKQNDRAIKEISLRNYEEIIYIFVQKEEPKGSVQWQTNTYLEWDSNQVLKRVYRNNFPYDYPIMHVGFSLKRIFESQSGVRYYEVQLANEIVVKEKEDLINFITIERVYSRKNKNQLLPFISTILYEEQKNKSLIIEKMYNAIGVFTDNKDDLVVCYPGEKNIMIKGTNGYQENIIKSCESKGIDDRGNFIELYYNIIELNTIPENCMLLVIGHSLIGTFFHVLKDRLDVFPNFFWLTIPHTGKTSFMEIFYCFLFGTELKNNDDIDSPSRLTQMATAHTSPLLLDDIDDLDPKVKSYIKSSSTRKKGRERLNEKQKLTSEETYTAYAGSGNDKKWLSEDRDEAFRDRCCISDEFKVFDEQNEDLTKFNDYKEELKISPITGPYLLKKCIQFIEEKIAGSFTSKQKLELFFKDKKQLIKQYLKDKKVNIFGSRRLTIYTLIYIGLSFWNYVFQIKGFNCNTIIEALNLEKDKFKEMILYYEKQISDFSFESLENILQFYENKKEKYDYWRNKEDKIMLTTEFVNDYDDWARKRGYETLKQLTTLGNLFTKFLREKIEVKNHKLKKFKPGELDSSCNEGKYSVIFPVEEIKAKLGIEETQENNKEIDVDRLFVDINETKNEKI